MINAGQSNLKTGGNRPLSVLFVLNSALFFLTHRLGLAQTLQKQGWTIHIATPLSSEAWIQKKIEDHHFIFHPLPLTAGSLNPLRELKTLWALHCLYRRLKPTLIHQLTIKPILYGSLVAKLIKPIAIINAVTGLGYVFSSKDFKARFVLKPLVLFAYRFLLNNKHSKAIFQNPEDQRLFIDKKLIASSQQALIKGSGVDVTQLLPLTEPSGEIKILCAARLLRSKGIEDYVNAAKILRERYPVRFILAGAVDSENPEAISESEILKWQKQGYIEWVGYQQNIAPLLAQVHIICLPTFYGEGIPKILLEAAACARPIVTTNIPGCREIVVDGKNGILVPPRHVEKLIVAIETLILNPSLRITMGKDGRQRVEAEFSLEKVNQQTIKLYQELLACVD